MLVTDGSTNLTVWTDPVKFSKKEKKNDIFYVIASLYFDKDKELSFHKKAAYSCPSKFQFRK